ncbi:hypothetical protein [Paracidovorax sp. MALMAid1276]|uniref:hypothetical protein n=1 Tax=Paracidovorax sp. MALMAid1276 TaxID=3411631 RepID=UPI003B9ABED4
MSLLLHIAAFLAFAVGLAHSVLGERYILTRLFRRGDLPRLFGGTAFTARTLRFAWHVTTIAWWGFAAILVLLAEQSFSFDRLALVVAATFLPTAALTAVISRGQHLAWPVFLFIGGVALAAAGLFTAP